MDTSAVKQPVGDKVELIKTRMPTVYKMIQDKAAEVGNDAYVWVRQGLRGEVNRFYAMERGYVVGTPFNISAINAAVAVNMVQFGVDACCIWPMEVTRGAH
ncbi:hypothetical protein [Rhodoferax sp. WC2427]|uniref:hypothetical protein n=1 Tax=Rhodoferax sp. WC2427 TaxID=3234144 RepID=UPI0034658A02